MDVGRLQSHIRFAAQVRRDRWAAAGHSILSGGIN
jgi:hypothetical protein